MKDLNEYVDQLCAELTELKCERWPHCAEDGAYYVAKAGRKYIKIKINDTKIIPCNKASVTVFMG